MEVQVLTDMELQVQNNGKDSSQKKMSLAKNEKIY
jgi:hypothetical protein